MRLNRKWLYLGGLITILTLLLTLTWALPAGAVGQLDDGTLSTDRSAVNPSPGANEDADANLTTVTLTNSALDKTSTVEKDGDFGPVFLTFGPNGVKVVNNRVIRVDIASGTSNLAAGAVILNLDDGDKTTVTHPIEKTNLWKDADTIAVLPITSDVSIDESASSDDVADKIDSIFVVNTVAGVIELTINADIDAGDKIYLSYTTSPQETALVNVAGDNANFNLLTVEGADTPAMYSATFETNESLTMNTINMIEHEQHAVPSGLRGFVEIDDEVIEKRYAGKDLKTDITDQVAAVNSVFYVQVAKPPIRTTVVVASGGNATVENLDKGIVKVTVGATQSIAAGASIELDYTGSDSFYINVDQGPIQSGKKGGSSKGTQQALVLADKVDDYLVVPSASYTGAAGNDPSDKASDMFKVISIEDADGGDTCWACRVRIGVVTGDPGDRQPTPLSTRISVLGISYKGSERIYLPNPERARTSRQFTATLDEQPADTNNDVDDGVQPEIEVVGAGSDPTESRDVFTVKVDGSAGFNITRDDTPNISNVKVKTGKNSVGEDFILTLENPPMDNNDADSVTVADIVVTKIGAVDGDVKGVDVSNKQVTLTINTPMAVGDIIIVAYRDSAELTATLEAAHVTAQTTTTGASAIFSLLPIAAVGENAYIDVTYDRGVGSNPRNALLPKGVDRPIIAVSAGSRATIESSNDDVAVDAEEDGPTFSNTTPAESAGVASPTSTLSIDVNDDVSGVDMETIAMVVKVGGATYDVENDDLTIEASGAGYRVSIDLDEVRHKGEGNKLSIDGTTTTTVAWSVSALDVAGNYETTDADTTATGDQDYMFNVDGVKATLEDAYTGDWFDETDKRVEGDRRLSPNKYQLGASDSGSIRLVFSEALDGSTIEASDFTVDGAAPLAAVWYGTGETGSSDGIDQSVFLSVPELAANATPEVAIVGSVSDKAGNATTTGTETAQDGIAPSPTLSVDKSLSTKSVQVTVNTDERIRTLIPTLELFVANALDGDTRQDEQDVFTVGREDADVTTSPLVLRDGNGDIVARNLDKATVTDFTLTLSKAPILVVDGVTATADASNGQATSKVTVSDAQAGEIVVELNGNWVAEDTITVTYRGTDPDPASNLLNVPTPAGKQVSPTSWTFDLSVGRTDRFAVTATVEDANRNRGTGGSQDANAAGATVFEIDNELAGGEAPDTGKITHDPSGNRPVSISEPFFIELKWDDEKGEYPGDSSNAVTLTKVELDGTDVMDSAVAQTDRSYRLSITGITLGDHTLTYNAEDAQGNAHLTDRVLKFTVQPVPTWDLPLNAGMNLVSVPSAPANGDVNELFGDVEQIDLIFTFEDGQSLVALRSQDSGEFVGTLKTIDSQHAYWVSVSNAVTVPISIPPTSQLAPPPYITVMGGQWNLVPVISLGAVDDDTVDVGAAPGTEVNADTYLGDFRTAFGWSGSNWQKIDPAADTEDDPSDVVVVGKGYWVLYDENAIITP